MRSLALALFASWLIASSGTGWAAPPEPEAEDLPAYTVADPDAAIVTEANLLASERFWPYHVGLVRAWSAPGGDSLPLGTTGVLTRIEDGGVARIDFGRDGLHQVPVAATDVVERANRVRRGELEKMAPNYVLAIGTRLVDAAADPPRGFSFREVGERRAFLSVFADPQSEDFAALAGALAPLGARADLLTIVFPQGDRRDAEVYERLRAIEWTVPFVHDHLTGPYTRTLLPVDVEPPAVLLQTREGRVLLARRWSADGADDLAAAIEQALPVETARSRP